MKEEFLSYGENERGFCIATLPEILDSAPVIVLFNAGLLHRTEPYRLNVLLARKLASIGYIVLRVDLSGNGDTPRRGELKVRESVKLDWDDLKKGINNRFGSRTIIVGGLCSGADNAIKLAAVDTEIKGLILLDPIAYKDEGFKKRQFIKKYFNPYRWLLVPEKLKSRLVKMSAKSIKSEAEDIDSLRDEPTVDEMNQCFSNIVASSGQVLLFFTSHVLARYNQQGQFCRVIAVAGLSNHCEEVFAPSVTHLYRVQTHRDRLIECIANWSSKHIENFKSFSYS